MDSFSVACLWLNANATTSQSTPKLQFMAALKGFMAKKFIFKPRVYIYLLLLVVVGLGVRVESGMSIEFQNKEDVDKFVSLLERRSIGYKLEPNKYGRNLIVSSANGQKTEFRDAYATYQEIYP
jgi:hypothetical protein